MKTQNKCITNLKSHLTVAVIFFTGIIACRKKIADNLQVSPQTSLQGSSNKAFERTKKTIYMRQESPINSQIQHEYADFNVIPQSIALPLSPLEHPYTTLPTIKIETQQTRAFKSGLLEEITEDITKDGENPTAVFSDIPINPKEKIVKIVRNNNNTQYYNAEGEMVRTHTSEASVDYKKWIDSAHYLLKHKNVLGEMKLQNFKKQGYAISLVDANEIQKHHQIDGSTTSTKNIGGRTLTESLLYKATLTIPESKTEKIIYCYPDKAMSERQGIFYVDGKIDYLVDFYYGVKSDSTLQLKVIESVMPQLRENGFNSMVKHTEIIEEDQLHIFE